MEAGDQRFLSAWVKCRFGAARASDFPHEDRNPDFPMKSPQKVTFRPWVVAPVSMSVAGLASDSESVILFRLTSLWSQGDTPQETLNPSRTQDTSQVQEGPPGARLTGHKDNWLMSY